MVRRNGDMPRHDNIPGGTGWLVSGYVYLLARWKGLGLDWRRPCGVRGAAATSKPSSVPYAVDGFPYPVDSLQRVHAAILRPDRKSVV